MFSKRLISVCANEESINQTITNQKQSISNLCLWRSFRVQYGTPGHSIWSDYHGQTTGEFKYGFLSAGDVITAVNAHYYPNFVLCHLWFTTLMTTIQINSCLEAGGSVDLNFPNYGGLLYVSGAYGKFLDRLYFWGSSQ